MKYFKNIRPYTVINMGEVVTHSGKQIASKSFINNEQTELRFFSYAKGETIDKEYYEMETIFFVIEGSLKIVYKEQDEVILQKGEMLALESDVDYGVEALTDCKAFNILVKS